MTGTIALAIYVAILGTKFVICRRYAALHPEHDRLDGEVTVMQPILGGDPFLADALRRNLQQRARFLWLVDEDDAEGQRVTRTLAAELEDRVEILLCPPAPAATNPKTFKLQRGLERVGTEHVAVLDDDTMLSDGQLQRAMFALQTCTIVTGLPCYLRGANLWSSLVAHFVNNNSITTYLTLLPLIGPLSINGMFYVMRTNELRAMGGFTSIVSQLCDDYALASLVKRHGGTIRQSITPQFLHTTVPDARRYIRLMHRWFVFANVLVRDQRTSVQLLLFVVLGMPPLLFWIGWLSPLVMLPVLVVRHLALRNLHRRVAEFQSCKVAEESEDPSATLSLCNSATPEFHWLTSIVAELLQPIHWLHACVQRTLRWRTRRITPSTDGTFTYDPV